MLGRFFKARPPDDVEPADPCPPPIELELIQEKNSLLRRLREIDAIIRGRNEARRRWKHRNEMKGKTP